MSQLLSVSEIVGYAIYIEKNGYEFYTESAKKLNDPKVLELFNYLAEQETRHEYKFKELQTKSGTYKAIESYPGEYSDYMEDYLKSIAPKSNESIQGLLEKVTTSEEAIDMALQFEKDSVVFYTTLKKLIKKEDWDLLDNIIEEEVNHVMMLNAFKAGKLPKKPDVDAS
ncbi:MAG: ferritin family protein [bacterium]|nr:ferritin family protein [bacterium]